VRAARIFPPHRIIAGEAYEGRKVEPDARVAATFAADRAAVESVRARPLGVTAEGPLWRAYDEESPLGNLVADLLREGVHGVDFALQNGTGLRADLPSGPIPYGAVYEALPFDSRPAIVTLRGGALRALLTENYTVATTSFLDVSGLRVRVACQPGAGVRVLLESERGVQVDDDREYRVAVADFLALGGDAFDKVLGAPGTRVEVLWNAPVIHDLAALALGRAGGTLRASAYYDRARPRVILPGPRPVCRVR
jgi:5'-nucleotidase